MAHLWESDHPYLLFRWDWNAWHLEHPEDYLHDVEQRQHVALRTIGVVGGDKGLNGRCEGLPLEQVRVWLAERARTTLSIWHPILGADK